MKNFIILSFIFLVVLVSCSSDDGNDNTIDLDAFPQEWTLVRMTIGMTDQTLTGNDMLYQERYLLQENGSFEKIRVQDGQESSAEGTFSYGTSDGSLNLTLNYEDGPNGIISNCGLNETEVLMFNSQKNQLESTYQICDGPTLIYELK
jgi:hypothetical protein